MTKLDQNEPLKKLKSRPVHAYKGNFGHVLVLAGSREMPGAAFMAGMASLRGGAGLVTLGIPECIYTVVARRQPELMVKSFPATASGGFSWKAFDKVRTALAGMDAVVLGPGLGRHPETQKLVRQLIQEPIKGPLVLDADGLNAFQGRPEIFLKSKNRILITPHPGEFNRLFGTAVSEDARARRQNAVKAAVSFKIWVILKGHHTVVAAPDGKFFVNPTGNPGMATAGTGDVLAGILAAFLAQGLSVWDSAKLGVFIHGKAGDLAAKEIGEISLMATDILDYLPKAIQQTRRMPGNAG